VDGTGDIVRDALQARISQSPEYGDCLVVGYVATIGLLRGRERPDGSGEYAVCTATPPGQPYWTTDGLVAWTEEALESDRINEDEDLL
jgi:hypothetical protein